MKNSWEGRQYPNVSIVKISNQVVAILERFRKELNQYFIFYHIHPPQKRYVSVIHDTAILHENNKTHFYFILPGNLEKEEIV